MIDFFFDYGSPFSYLADAQLPKLAARHGVALRYRPFLLGGVFKAVENRSPLAEPVAPKRRYFGEQLQRAAALTGVPLEPNPHFPVHTLAVMRLAVAAQQLGVFDAYHRALFPALWRRKLDLGAQPVQADVMREAGLDAGQLFARAQEQRVKDELRANTDEAVARGAFGAPTFFVNPDGGKEQMFFGVDHLPHLDHALKTARAK